MLKKDENGAGGTSVRTSALCCLPCLRFLPLSRFLYETGGTLP